MVKVFLENEEGGSFLKKAQKLLFNMSWFRWLRALSTARENPDLPEEKRQEIRTLAIAQSASSQLGLQLVAIKCLAALHDSVVTARLTDLKDHSPLESVRVAAGFALRGIAFPGESR